METIVGRKHAWCGRINWDGKDECHFCKSWGRAPKEMYQFTDVVLDKPDIISLGKIARRLIDTMGLKYSIGYDVETENEAGDVVGALILDGWVLIYPEPHEVETISGYTKTIGYAIDVETVTYGGRDEPDSLDVNRVDYSTNAWGAVSKALSILFQHQLDYTIEGLALTD